MLRPGEPAGRAAVQAVGVECLPMPSAFFRLFAVLLLALTIPVQGVAAVVAGQCMAFGHHEDAGSQDHAHDGADGHGQASHSHADADDAKQGGQDESSSHCGPCTACCASASIAGPVGISIPSAPSNVHYVFSQFPPLGVQPHGLYRPPLAL